MRSPRSCRLARVGWLLLAFLVLGSRAALAYTEAQESFMKGVRAHDEGNYAEAVPLLSEAVRRDGKEALASFKYKGLNKEDYLPYFYLGRCFEKLGRSAEALEAFRESERQGAIRGRASLSAILRTSMARLDTSRLEASIPKPTPAVVAAVETRPVPAPSPSPSPPPVPAASPAEPRPVQATGAVPPREEFVLSEIPGGQRAVFAQGLRSFFAAEYEEALKTLDPLVSKLPQARAFRAYSRAGLWLTTGGGEGTLIQAAREDYRLSRKYIRAESERKWISPAILRALTAGETPQRSR